MMKMNFVKCEWTMYLNPRLSVQTSLRVGGLKRERSGRFFLGTEPNRNSLGMKYIISTSVFFFFWLKSAQVLLARVLLPTVQMKRKATRREKQKFCQSFPNNLLQLYVHLINYNRIHWTPGMKLGLNKRYACTRLKN